MQAESDLFIPIDTNRIDSFINMKAKELSVEIDKIAIKNDLTQVNLLLSLKDHKSVAVRRKVIKVLGNLGTKHIIPSLEEWREKESDNESYLLLTSLISKIGGIDKRSKGEGGLKPLKVGEVIKIVKNLVGGTEYLIEGEISEPKTYGSMLYFGLKDEEETRIDCRILTYKLNQIDFPLNEGLQVLIKGKFSLNKNTKLVFEVQKIELTGEGALLRNLKKLESKLKSEGLFDEDRKRQIPSLPRNILLVASPNSAAINDFTKVLFARRVGGINVHLLPIKTQGKYAEAEILNQLERAVELCPRYDIDTIVITRGGGSKDDLHVFNSEKVVRKINSLPKPTIVAIGHERDFTLSEFVCDKRASTPSNAAELVSRSSSEVINSLNQLYKSIVNNSRQRVEGGRQFMNRYIDFTILSVRNKISINREVLNKANIIGNQIIENTKNDINQNIEGINYLIKNRVRDYKYEIESIKRQSFNIVNNNFRQVKHDFEILCLNVSSRDPKKVLKMGYSLVKQGKADIDSVKKIDKAKPLTLVFHDGETKVG